MSGFDVLGVVLGTIPLVISALEHYQEGIHTIRRWHSYEAELQSLKRKLGNENAIFINTCQQLLSGIVRSVDHEKLINEPFGELWGDPEIQDQVALRLDHVYKPFNATVVAMVEALEEVKVKLGLDERGEVKWKEGKAIVREIKRFTFTIKRSDYDELLNTISKGNQDLKTLTNQSIQLEPERRIKYHGKLFSQLKEVSSSVYRALRNSLTCGCPGSHRVSLRLAKPKLTPRNEDEQMVQNSNFECALSYGLDDADTAKDCEAWTFVMLRLYEPPPPNPLKPNPLDDITTQRRALSLSSTSVSLLSNAKISKKRPRRVKFSSESILSFQKSEHEYTVTETVTTPRSIATLTAAKTSLQIAASIIHLPLPQGQPQQNLEDPINLCNILRKGINRHQAECLGLISDNTAPQRFQRFGVHPLPEGKEKASIISLRDILEDVDADYPSLTYADGLKLAVDISSGVLQLHKTSWLPGIITSRDVVFLVEDGYPDYSQAFIVKKISSDSEELLPPLSKVTSTATLKRAMFSLGILLLEVFFFEVLDSVWDFRETKVSRRMGSQFSDWKAAKDLLNRVQTMGSPKFYSATHRFLFCEFTSLDTTETFCKEVYGKAISLLEEDYQSSQSLW
ncbi:hypothetical protein BX600DRAFT_555505 [Xylariales sp. PMI_506]|nr:hypothetical protein BX600DRAFT_555505 [Xylariales sp. PMI_506]